MINSEQKNEEGEHRPETTNQQNEKDEDNEHHNHTTGRSTNSSADDNPEVLLNMLLQATKKLCKELLRCF